MSDSELDHDLIKKAAHLLRDGQLLSFPTETVYGLGADATNPEAIKRLYEAKGRPSSHPVIVHLHSPEQVRDWAIDIPDNFHLLARTFWPGPMTVILKRASKCLDAVTGGQNTVGLRVPNHPLALALLKEFGGGVVAPSANKFGRLSPTQAQDVRDEFGDELPLVLDGGPCQVGIESTIVDLSGSEPRILRPGMLSQSEIFSALKMTESKIDSTDPALSKIRDIADGGTKIRVPGSLASHYAPSTPVQLVSSTLLNQFISARLSEGVNLSVISFQSRRHDVPENSWITLPLNPQDFARQIYGSLRQLDRLNLQLIVVETPFNQAETPSTHEGWEGIIDRLQRAAHTA